MVDIENRFRNIQGLKYYQSSLFLLCVQKIANKKWFGYGWRKKYYRKIADHQYYTQQQNKTKETIDQKYTKMLYH